LGEGGKYDRCGWLDDKFGVSWQIVPTILPKLMADPAKAPRVVEAFMKMTKFDIETLVNA
jgi:predicted 3-demethylubiquinone-9 3-methyltransferase (glyoxalase superfamily)